MPPTLFILNDPPDGSERSYNGLRPARTLNDLAAWTAEADKVLVF